MNILSKRVLAVLLTLVMLVSLCPATFAAETEQLDEESAGVVTVSVSDNEVEVSESDQTVQIKVYVDKNIQIASVSANYASISSGLTINSVTSASGLTVNAGSRGISISDNDGEGKYLDYDSSYGAYLLMTINATVAGGTDSDVAISFGQFSITDADNGCGYEIASWSKSITITVAASVTTYTVSWVVNGETTTATYNAGDTPSYGSVPEKAADAQNTYTFAGWRSSADNALYTDPLPAVSGDVTYTAEFTPAAREYTVTFLDYDNTTVLDTQSVAYGATPVYGGETPVRAEDEDYTYEFSGWTPALAAVTGDTTYTAVYTATPKEQVPVISIDLGSGTYPWIDSAVTPLTDANIPGTVVKEQYYYSSNYHVASSQSTMTITVNPDADGYLTFDYLSSGEGGYDNIRYKINGGSEINTLGSSTKANANTLPWKNAKFYLEAGESTTFQIYYRKDSSGDSGSDRGYLADIQFVEANIKAPLTVTFENGTVSGNTLGALTSGTSYDIVYGKQETLTATPAEGYYFVGWYTAGELVSESKTYTVTSSATADLTLEARFAQAAVNSIAVEFPAGVSVSVSIGGASAQAVSSGAAVSVYQGQTVTVTYSGGSYIRNGIYEGDTLLNSTGTFSYTSATEGDRVLTIGECYQAIAGYTAPDYLTAKTVSPYPWVWDAESETLSTTNQNVTDISELVFVAEESGALSLEYKVSSEAKYDSLLYRKNTEITTSNYSSAENYGQRANYSGEVDWTEQTFVLNAGDKLFMAYSKDSYYQGEDTVWLRNIVFLTEDPTITVESSNTDYGTVSAVGIDENNVAAITSTVTVTAAATEDGQFVSWAKVLEGGALEVVATTPEYSFIACQDVALRAVFAPAVDDADVVARINDAKFASLDDAMSYALPGDVVILCKDYTQTTDLTVPASITLLIPYDTAQTSVNLVYPEQTSYTTPSAYKTLTIANNATITVAGTMIVDSKVSASGQGATGHNGEPTGPYGKVAIDPGSSIVVNGQLSVWGYITASNRSNFDAWNESGNQAVIVNSGAILRESFQLRDWRGGSHTLFWGADAFPFSQFYVQNIEVPLKIVYGGNEYVNLTESVSPAHDVKFVAADGMFNMTSGYLTRNYNVEKDQMVYRLYGNVNIQPITAYMSSSSYVLPINSGLSLNIMEGSTVTIAEEQSVEFLPGSELIVEEGATLNLPNDNIVYDADDWPSGAVFSGRKITQVPYISITNGAPTAKTANTDALFDINGTVNVSGNFYTTEHGADIHSSQYTGKIVYSTDAPDQTTTSQSTGRNPDLPVTISAAQLHNVDGSYTDTAGTAAGETFYNISGYWVKDFTVTFDKNNEAATGTMDPQTFAFNADPVALNALAFTLDNYSFLGWATSADGAVVYEDEEEVSFTPANGASLTLYAVWGINNHTVSFVDEDGTTILQAAASYPHGTAGSDITKPAEPTKQGDAQYSYTFAGWTDGAATYATANIPAVTADVVYRATYTPVINSYDITWVDGDGETLKTETLQYGVTPAYTGNTPTKAATAQYTYSYNSKWSDTQDGEEITIPAVTADATYYALFDSTVNEYTIKFVDDHLDENDEEIVLATYTLPYGETPEYDGEEPEKEETEQFYYEFVGWTDGETVYEDALPAVTGDATYIAVYNAEVQEYVVTWVFGYGDTEEIEFCEYGHSPILKDDEGDPIIPTMLETDQYVYEFIGWSSDDGETIYDPRTQVLPAVTGDITYVAQYSETLKSYTITFVDEDGTTVLDEQTVDYGVTPAYAGPAPTKQGNAQYSYTFSGWSPTVVSVTGDKTYTATYTQSTNQYTVTWYDEDGTTVLGSQTVDYGADLPAYSGETPTKAATAQYTYTFDSWATSDGANISDGKVIGAVNYTAVYSSVVNQYTVTWYDEDGTTELDSQTVNYGTSVPTYAGETPTKEGDAQYSYTFNCWTLTAGADNIENGAIIGDVSYTATYEQSVNEYVITWMNYNGTETLATTTVAYGETPVYTGTAPTRPANASYSFTFIGWNTEKNRQTAIEIPAVTGEATYYAAYSAQPNVNIQFKAVDVDGSFLCDTNVYPFETVSVPQADALSGNYTVPAPMTVSYYKTTGKWIVDPDLRAIEVNSAEDIKAAVATCMAENSGLSTVIVAAEYVRMTYTINFFSVLPDGTTTAHGSYPSDGTRALVGKSTIVTAPSEIGQYAFDHWIVNGQTYYSPTFSFMPTTEGDYDAYAHYVAKEQAADETVSFRISQQFAEKVGSKQKIGMTLEVTVPAGYKILNTGFKYTTSTKTQDISDPTKYSTSRSSMLSNSDLTTGTYTLRIVTKKTVYAFAYLEYEDGEGVSHTLYATKDGSYDPNAEGASFTYDTLIWSELY